MSKKLIAISFAALSVATLCAQDTTKISALDEVIVTSNKYPKKQSQTGKVVTIINREQLDRSHGKTLGEILNTIPGTTIIGANNNLGTNQTVSIRGASAGNVLILVDGIPVNDPSVITNYFDLNFISTEHIERIEILKGGQSTLYGSDAVAGVVNVITKKPTTSGLQGDLLLSGGSYGTAKGNINLQAKAKRSEYGLQYGYIRSDGFSSATDSTGKQSFDRDGFNQHVVTGSWQYDISKRLQSTVFGQFSRYYTDLDAAAFTDEKDYSVINRNAQAGAGLRYTIPNGLVRFNYRYNYVERAYEDDSSYQTPFIVYSKSNYKGKTHFAELYANWNLSHVEILAGIDYRKNSTDQETFYIYSFGPSESTLPDSLAHMWQISPYASFVYKPTDKFSVEVGGRWNYHSQYGNNFTYTFNPSYLLNNRVKIFANLYSAFKTPTLYQLFDPMAGNLSLEAEKSFVGEGGLQFFANKQLDFRALYFYRNTENAIQYIIVDPNTFQSQYRNVNRQRNKGIEVEMNYRNERWNASANYTYNDGSLLSPYDATGALLGKDTTYSNLYRIPRNAFNVTVGLQATKQLYVSTALKVIGDRLEPIYGAAPQVLDSYYTWDVYGEYKIRNNIRAFADLKNITDQKYVEILGYNTRGFNVNAGVVIGFQKQAKGKR